MRDKILILSSIIILALVITGCDSNISGKAFETPTTTNAVSAPSSSAYNLEIFSTPNGAEVFIDGSKVGVTPLSLDGQTKSLVSIRISKAGYEDYSINLNAPPGDTYYIGPKLKPQ